MDIDKPLDDFITDKRKPRVSGGADRKPRQSRDRRDAAPYQRPPTRSTDEKWVHDAYTGPGREREGRGERAPRGDRGIGNRDDAASGAAFVGASPRVEVSGIHYEVTVDELKSIFDQAGTIVQGPTIRYVSLLGVILTDSHQYDRSGRSTGIATVEYASAAHAKVAINKFDGAMTKGQTISIKLIAPPRAPRKEKKDEAAAEKSLLSRIGAGDLSSRIGGTTRETRSGDRQREPREPRERGDHSNRERGDRGGKPRGGRGGARGGRGGGRPAKRGPANADDLDKELDGFMKPDGADVAMA